MTSRLSIIPFINSKGEDRFKVVGLNGNTFIDAFGHGYHTNDSAYNGILMFVKSKNYKKSCHKK